MSEIPKVTLLDGDAAMVYACAEMVKSLAAHSAATRDDHYSKIRDIEQKARTIIDRYMAKREAETLRLR